MKKKAVSKKTKEKQMEPALTIHKSPKLLDSAQRLRALLKALPVGITFSTDTTCEFITGNPYILNKLEMGQGDNISMDALKDDNVAGRKLRHFINGKQITGAEMPMQRAIAENRQTDPVEIEVELPSGKRWIHEAVGAPIHDENGNVVASVAVNVDLTERKRAEEANRLEALMKQEKVKLEFIADAAHELRTPLAIIKGNVDLALHAKTRDAQSVEETLKAINNEVMHLDNLLSDLALLTTGGEFHRTVVNRTIRSKELITRIAKRHQAFARERGISIHIGTLPVADLNGDERYIERLFSNIIANAIRYGKDNGDVWISGRKTAKSVSVDIKDNGVGISSQALPHIFERFYRAESSRSKETGGTGLGLAIVKWIAEAHNGTVTATSKEGKGSIFTVTLPIAK
ncbi:MAG TPA: ATP-binding protein [Candidatus Paceibacterota bacterium]